MANYDPNDSQRQAGKPETYVEPVARRASPLPLIIGILLALAIAYFVLQYFMGRHEVATTGEDAAVTTTVPAEAEAAADNAAAAADTAATAAGNHGRDRCRQGCRERRQGRCQ
jgi:hypothetical protein